MIFKNEMYHRLCVAEDDIDAMFMTIQDLEKRLEKIEKELKSKKKVCRKVKKDETTK